MVVRDRVRVFGCWHIKKHRTCVLPFRTNCEVSQMSRLELIATSTFGLEAIVARELKQLGYEEQTVEDGRVTFVADEMAIARCNLWLRSADRVLLKMGSFKAADFGALFDQTKALPWADWIPEDGEFPVDGRSVNSKLRAVPSVQGSVKKAIVESLRKNYTRFKFEETGPKYQVEVSLLRDQALLTIDTTGEDGLHKRGYRTSSGAAPLKETLAAALVQLSYWNRSRVLIDPFCGSGTIPIEAAMIGRNKAPGLDRNFVAQDWPVLPNSLWKEARTEARDNMLGKPVALIMATDHDGSILKRAREHARNAGMIGDIQFERKEISELQSARKYGCIICNPPYGQRMGDREQVDAAYRELARVCQPLDTWSFYVLTSHPVFERFFGRQAERRRKLYNGRIECTYYQFNGPRPPAAPDADSNPDA